MHRPTAFYDTIIKDTGSPIDVDFTRGEHVSLRCDSPTQFTLVKPGQFRLLAPDQVKGSTSGIGKILPGQARIERQLAQITPSATEFWYPGVPKIFRGLPVTLAPQSPWIHEKLWMADWIVRFDKAFGALRFEMWIEDPLWLQAVLKSEEREGILQITLLHEWRECWIAWAMVGERWPYAPLALYPALMKAVQGLAHNQTIKEIDNVPDPIEYLRRLGQQLTRLGFGDIVKQQAYPT